MVIFRGFRIIFVIIVVIILTYLPAASYSSDELPYSFRSKAYNGAASTIRGDLNFVGMSGAGIGLGDSQSASFGNPAGLSHTLAGADASLSKNQIVDGQIQSEETKISSYHSGVALASYPWGFAVNYGIRNRENNIYHFNKNQRDFSADILNADTQFALSRFIDAIKTSFGLGLHVGRAEENIHFLDETNPYEPMTDTAFGITVAGQSQFKNRVLVSLAYSTPMHYDFNPSERPSEALSDFYRPILVPSQISAGVGMIPNRHFRIDLSLTFTDSMKGTSLLSDEGVEVGTRLNLKPRFGLNYQFLDFNIITTSLFLGSYLEQSRVQFQPTRAHFTVGINARIWMLRLGFAADYAHRYQNRVASVAIDAIRVGEFLGIIPKIPRAEAAGALPSPFHLSDQGLPRPLVSNWDGSSRKIDPVKTGLSVPKRLKEKVDKTKKGGLKGLGESIINTVESVPLDLKEQIEKDLQPDKPKNP